MNPSKTLIITGGNSGLGYQSAKEVAKEGDWLIVIASRNQARLETAVARLKGETGCTTIVPMLLDLGSFSSIRTFAQQFSTEKLPPLHAIICNAGVSPTQNQQTIDGIDMTFGINHLGHYLLVHLLTNHLVDPARIIFVSSGTHIPEHKLARRFGVPVPKYTTASNLAYPNDASELQRIDAPAQRYSTSKLCNMLCAYEFARQLQVAGRDVSVFGLDPGLMPGTGLTRDMPTWLIKTVFIPAISLMERWVEGIRFPEISGKDMARLVLDGRLAGKTALYFDGHRETRSSDESYDLAKAIDLWNTSSDLCGLNLHETSLPVQI